MDRQFKWRSLLSSEGFSSCFVLIVFLFCSVSSLSATTSSTGFEVTFHNVGQGNCTVIKSPKKQILIVDAGSSNTTGVPELTGSSKYEALAHKIFTSIQADLQESGWLWFVVSHPDKDHLNLVHRIIECASSLKLSRSRLGVLLGGPSNIYKKKESRELVEFLERTGISHFYGARDYELQKGQGVFYVPRDPSSPILAGWEGDIQFLSVDSVIAKTLSATRSKGKKIRTDSSAVVTADADVSVKVTAVAASASTEETSEKEDDTNKVSIIMKVSSGSFSVMLTGDKTKKETKAIIGRLTQTGQEAVLKSDVLLATHHGSLEDYVPEWVQHVNPTHVVFSSGRSFDHPRAKTVEGYITQARGLATYPWHFMQFHGDFFNKRSIGTTTGIFADGAAPSVSSYYAVKSLVLEVPSSVESARGYVHAITNRAIFVTANQGDITFYGDGRPATISGLKEDKIDAFPIDLVRSFFTNPVLLDGSPIQIEEINLDEEPSAVPLIATLVAVPSLNNLKRLSLKANSLTTEHTAELCKLIENHTNLSNLDLADNTFGADTRKIQEAWGYRGLLL